MKATSLLHRDHQEVQRLFGQIERSRRGSRRSELIAQLQRALETHARIEEEIFYPALETRREAQDHVREAYQEHEVVKSLLREVTARDADDPDTEAKLKVLRENVEHHVEEEEGQLFPVAEGMGEQRLMELGDELAARKRSLSEGMVGGVVRGVRSLLFGEEEEEKGRTRRRRSGTRAKSRRSGSSSRRKRTGGRSRASSRSRSASRRRARSRAGSSSRGTRTRARRGAQQSARRSASTRKRGQSRARSTRRRGTRRTATRVRSRGRRGSRRRSSR